MSISDSAKVETLFKKYIGVANAWPGTDPTGEYPASARGLIFPNQLLGDSVPASAPTDLSGIEQMTGQYVDAGVIGGTRRASAASKVVRYTNIPLIAVRPGRSYRGPATAAAANLLSGTVPANYDSGGNTYAYILYNGGVQMAPNDQTYPWLLDTDAGIITFYGTAEVPADAALTMTFWRYEGRIGVGEQSTVTQLTLGTANVENNLIVAGSIAAGKSTAPTATLDVAGAVAVSGNANLGTNTLRVEGANVGVGKGTGIISKTLDVGGTLEVAGTATLLGVAAVGRGTAGNNTLDVSGTVGVASRLAVGKTSAPTNAMEVVGNQFVSGRLTVGSQTIGANVVDVTGNAGISGQVYVGKNTGTYAVDVSGTVGVTGATALLGSVAVGKTSAGAALDVSGAGRFSGAVGISGDLIVGGTILDVDAATRTVGIGKISTGAATLDVSGSAAVSQSLAVSGNVSGGRILAGKTVAGSSILDVSGSGLISGGLTIGRTVAGSAALDVSGGVYISRNLDVSGAANITGVLDVDGNGNILGRTTIERTDASGVAMHVMSNSLGGSLIGATNQNGGSDGNGQLYVGPRSAQLNRVAIGYDAGANVGVVNALTAGATAGAANTHRLLALNPFGGGVAIGKTAVTAGYALDVSGGGIYTSGSAYITGITSLNDNVTIATGKTLTVNGTTSLNDNVTVAATKNLIVGGRIGAGSTAAPSAELDVSGAARVSGLATLTGGLTTPASVTTTGSGALSIAGNGTVGGTLGVTGLATLTGGVSVPGTSQLTGNVGIGKASGSVALDVSGSSVMNGDLRVVGDIRVGANNSTNTIRFRGTLYDGDGSYTHTVIGENRYEGQRKSELLLFKGDDAAGTSGPDRVRVLARGGFQVDISASGVWDTTVPTGVTAFIVDSNGNVGVGRADPIRTLDVSGTLGVTGLTTLTGGVSVPGTSQLTGNVGVGKASGSVALDVSGAAAVSGTLGVTGLATLTGGLTTPASVTTTGSGALSVAGAATLNSGLSVTGNAQIIKQGTIIGTYGVNNDSLVINSGIEHTGGGIATILLKSSDDFGPYARIAGIDTHTIYPNNSPCGALIFQTANTTSATGTILTEQMRIMHNGNVGIGTTTPNARLDLLGGSNSDGGAGTPLIALQHYLAGGYTHFIKSRHNVGAVSTNAIDFYLNSGTTATASTSPGVGNVHGMSITAAGVGIGTSTPTEKLEIYGGTLRINTRSEDESRLSQDLCGNYIYASARSTHLRLGGWGSSGAKPFLLQPAGGGVCINQQRLPEAGFALDVAGAAKVNGIFNATGNTAIGGTLGVTGATTISNTLGVTGNTTVGGILDVTGNTTLKDTLGVTGNTTVGGTLGVTGLTTLSGELRVGSSDNANLIRFRGTPGEGPGAYTNTVIGEYRYDTTGNAERSELLLYKGNDVAGLYGPDRVRVLASGGFQVDISTGEAWAVGGNPPGGTPAFIVNSSGNVGIGNGAPTPGYKLDVTGATNITGNLNVTGTITGAITSSLGVQYI